MPLNLILPGAKLPVPGLLLDVSRGGLFVKGSSQVELSSKVVVRFRLRMIGRCEADGHIVRRTEVVRLHGFGVHFEKVNDEFGEFMDNVATLRPESRVSFLAEVMSPVVEVSSA